jgi:chaperonin GroES
MLNLEKRITLNQEMVNDPNLVDRLSERDRETIAGRIWTGYERDKRSRSKWESRMDAAMDLAMQIAKSKNFPWPGCSNVVFPLVTIAALQFSARAYGAIIQGSNVVRYKIVGKADEQMRERALRIGKHMSWQVLEEDEDWEEQHDRLLINLAVVGSAFVKTYFDRNKGHLVGELVSARDLIVDYNAKSVESAARKTHIISMYRNEVYERALSGLFVDVRKEEWFHQAPQPRSVFPESDVRSGTSPAQADEYTPFRMLEQHTWFDLDGDGYAEPYVGTIEFNSRRLVRLVTRFHSMDDVEYTRNREVIKIHPEEYFDKYSFIPSPDGGFYDMGFGLFLGPINEAVSSGINQLLDLGTIQNSNGGFLGRGAKIRGGVYTLAPYEWKRVDSPGDDLRKNIVPFPERAPNNVMFQLLGLLIEYANRVAGTVDATVGENPGQNTPASTYQGMQEQGMRVYTMIFKRVWRCMKAEFKRRYELNALFLDIEKEFGDGRDFIRLEDYRGSPAQVVPVVNPNLSSTTMRIQQVMLVKQDSMMTPGYNLPEITHDFLEAIEVEDIDRIYPGPGKVPQGHEMTNPKAVQAQMKLQEAQMKYREQRLKWAHELLEQQRVNNAKIRLDEANALKAISEAKSTNAAMELERYNAMVEAADRYNDQVNERIKALLQEPEGGTPASDAGARMEQLAGQPGSTEYPGVPGQVLGGPVPAMGNGSIPEGQ